MGNDIRDQGWGVNATVWGYGLARWQHFCPDRGLCGLPSGAAVPRVALSSSCSQWHPDTISYPSLSVQTLKQKSRLSVQ